MLKNFFNSRELMFQTPFARISNGQIPELSSKVVFFDRRAHVYDKTVVFVGELTGDIGMLNLDTVRAFECGHYLLLEHDDQDFNLIRRPTGATRIVAIQTVDGKTIVGFEETENYCMVAAEMHQQTVVNDSRRLHKFFDMNHCTIEEFGIGEPTMKIKQPHRSHAKRRYGPRKHS